MVQEVDLPVKDVHEKWQKNDRRSSSIEATVQFFMSLAGIAAVIAAVTAIK